MALHSGRQEEAEQAQEQKVSNWSKTMAEPEATGGQAEVSDQQATESAPAPESGGQSVTPSQTTNSGPGDTGKAEESFFDPKSIEDKPELMQAYKQMQRDYSKKMQGIRSNKQKIEAYDAAMQNPERTIRQLASQYGLTVVNGAPQSEQDEEFNPKNWDDVVDYVRKQVEQDYAPVLNEVKSLKQQSIESHFDQHYPDWREHEDEMVTNLRKHPSLAHDPDTLYRVSVPQEVWESRAYNRALKKLKGTAESSQVSGANRATQETSNKPSGPLSLDQAVDLARDQLAKKGLRPPGL